MKSWGIRLVIYGGLLFVVVHFTRIFWALSSDSESSVVQNNSSAASLKAPETLPLLQNQNNAKAEKSNLQNMENTAVADIAKPLEETADSAPELSTIDRRLTAAQVETYVAIAKGLIDAANAENNKFKQKYEKMLAQKKAESAVFSPSEQEAILKEYGESVVVAVQAAGIELRASHEMSFDDYEFVSKRVYEAIPFMILDMPSASASKAEAETVKKRESAAAIDVMQRQNTKGIASVEQTRANAKLLKPYADILITSISEPLLMSALQRPEM
jgi:hypothetical protein